MPPFDGRAAAGKTRCRPSGRDHETFIAAYGKGGPQSLYILRKNCHVGKTLDLRCGVIAVDEKVFPVLVYIFCSHLLSEMIDDGFCQHGAPPCFTTLQTERAQPKGGDFRCFGRVSSA